MVKFVFLILILGLFQPAEVLDWVELPSQSNHYKLYSSVSRQKNKWVGCTDPNYAWDGNRLSYQREVTDKKGKKRIIKTYKQPIEIIAKFNAKTKVYGIDNGGGIERATAKKFRGALKGFIWLDNVSGSGKVTLPFTAPHIFIATGDRLNPTLTEIGTNSNTDNYYEVIEGKTRVVVKSFSGVGGAASSPATLIAHYKMNENTASDNDELVINGTFAAWSGDNPTSWAVAGESGADPMVNEVGTGEGQGGAGTGMCNLYSSVGDKSIEINQTVNLTVGRKYRYSITIDTVTDGELRLYDKNSGAGDMFSSSTYTSAGTYTLVFIALRTTLQFGLKQLDGSGAIDITLDDVSIKLCAAEDSSGNDYDGLLQEDTSAASVTGIVSTAFDFDGAADYIEIADHVDFTPALTPFSISAWVYMHDATHFKIACKMDISGGTNEWYFGTKDSADDLRWTICDNALDQNISILSDSTLTAYEDQWIHLVATYDGSASYGGLELYINGDILASSDVSQGTFVSAENTVNPTYIGQSAGPQHANGLIDNVVFFSTDLSIEEVQDLYNHGSGTEILAEIGSRRRFRTRGRHR